MFRQDPLRRVLDEVCLHTGQRASDLWPIWRLAFRWGGVVALSEPTWTLTRGLGVAPLDRFELASVTKPLTATLVAALVRAERMDWEAPLSELGGPFRRLPRSLTPLRLACHTSGLPPHPGRTPLVALLHYHSPYEGLSAAAALRSGQRWGRRAAPDRFAYSNLGAGLLGLAAASAAQESITPEGYSAALTRFVVRPLGLPSVGPTPSSSQPERGPPAQGWARPRGPLGQTTFTQFGVLAGAGGLSGNAADLLTLGQQHLTGEAGQHWQQVFRPRGLPPRLSGVAPGWFVSSRQHTGDLFWHDGVARGTRTALGFNASTGRVGVVLARGSGGGAVSDLLLRLLSGT